MTRNHLGTIRWEDPAIASLVVTRTHRTANQKRNLKDTPGLALSPSTERWSGDVPGQPEYEQNQQHEAQQTAAVVRSAHPERRP